MRVFLGVPFFLMSVWAVTAQDMRGGANFLSRTTDREIWANGAATMEFVQGAEGAATVLLGRHWTVYSTPAPPSGNLTTPSLQAAGLEVSLGAWLRPPEPSAAKPTRHVAPGAARVGPYVAVEYVRNFASGWTISGDVGAIIYQSGRAAPGEVPLFTLPLGPEFDANGISGAVRIQVGATFRF